MFPQMLQFENVLKSGQKYFGSVTNSSRVMQYRLCSNNVSTNYLYT